MEGPRRTAAQTTGGRGDPPPPPPEKKREGGGGHVKLFAAKPIASIKMEGKEKGKERKAGLPNFAVYAEKER